MYDSYEMIFHMKYTFGLLNNVNIYLKGDDDVIIYV